MTYPTQTSVLTNFKMALVDRLTQYLIDEVDDSYLDPELEAKAGVLRAGKLQDDPLVGAINILLHTPDETMTHRLADMSGTGIKAPTYEIGSPNGAAWFMRPLRVEFKIFLEIDDRFEAETRASVVFSRAQWAIFTFPVREMKNNPDSFGESVQAVQVSNGNTYIREGGGPGTFIWRGNMFVEYLTHFDPIANPFPHIEE